MAGQVKSGMFFDLTALEKSLVAVAKVAMPEAARKGLYNAAAALIQDAIKVEPKVPRSKGGGHLIRSALRAVDPNPADISVLAGFNIEYAVYVHEMVPLEVYGEKSITWTEPGSGPKYLESKLPMFKNKYINIACETIRKAIFKK